MECEYVQYFRHEIQLGPQRTHKNIAIGDNITNYESIIFRTLSQEYDLQHKLIYFIPYPGFFNCNSQVQYL